MSLIAISLSAFSKEIESDQYRRNSLCTIFLAETKTDVSGTSDFIVDAMNNYVFPDKFNNHCVLESNIVDISNVPVEEKYREQCIKAHKMGLGKALGNVLASNVTIKSGNNDKTIYDSSQKKQDDEYYRYDLPARIIKYINDSHIANLLIAKWFNASEEQVDGSCYNMELIKSRGAYNASELDKLKAKEAIRGHAILEDAGMELIPNTYVTVTVFEFYSLSKMLEDAREHKDFGSFIENIKQFGKQVKSTANSFAGKSGYQVIARTYLFKLDWDKNTEDNFINNYWGSPIQSLLGSEDFHMKYMGMQKSSVWFTTKSEDTSDLTANAPLARLATNRAIDETLAKLMDKFEDFRVKAPLINAEEGNISAFIGTKEGVNKKSKFEVLEKEYNEKDNTFRYHKVGTLNVDKNRIWDDREKLDNMEVNSEDKYDYNPNVDRTYFIGNAEKLAPGMLIRQCK